MAADPKPPSTLAELAARLDRLEQKLHAVALGVDFLCKLLSEPPATAGGKRKPRLAPAQAAEEHKRRTFRARIARAASRYGVTVEEWIERFGHVDRLPEGVARPPRSQPVRPYQRRENARQDDSDAPDGSEPREPNG